MASFTEVGSHRPLEHTEGTEQLTVWWIDLVAGGVTASS